MSRGEPLPQRALGAMSVPAVGFGAMVLSGVYQPVDEQGALAALAAAAQAGSTFIDTSDRYGRDGHNEALLGRFLGQWPRDEVQIATKFGLAIPPGEPAHRTAGRDAVSSFAVNAEPRLVRRYLEGSLARLGTDHVDLYYPHFPDPEVPIEETVGAIAELVQAGLVRHIGLSNVDADHLRRAAAVHPIAAVQIEWSMWHPVDEALRRACEHHGTGLVAYSPLGRGFLSGELHALDGRDFRRRIDRFAAQNLAANNQRFEPLRELAGELAVAPSQLALAWLLHQHPSVVPIPGSRDPAHVTSNAASAHLHLDPATMARIDEALARFVPAGETS